MVLDAVYAGKTSKRQRRQEGRTRRRARVRAPLGVRAARPVSLGAHPRGEGAKHGVRVGRGRAPKAPRGKRMNGRRLRHEAMATALAIADRACAEGKLAAAGAWLKAE